MLLAGLAACDGAASPPNLLLISIDTLRADRLGCYGYERDTTPALDRFASERALRFEHVIAESSWTLPSHVTMLSGLHPVQHGVRLPEHAPSEEIELMAQRLEREGYYGFAITDGGWLTEGWGFDRGFASFDGTDRDFAQTVRIATEFIRHREEKGPWFGFLHTYDVHCPYDPPEPFASMFAAEGGAPREPIETAGRCGNPDFNSIERTPAQDRYLSDRYDGGIRWVDEALDTLFRFLDTQGLWENTVVVITSDHGEELGEHGRIGHEGTLFREVLEVPLLIAAPGLEAKAVDGPVGLMEIKSGVLELLGLESGSLLLAAMEDRVTALESTRGRTSELVWKVELSSSWTPEQHRIFDAAFALRHSFRLNEDPLEQHDRADEDAESSSVDAIWLEDYWEALREREAYEPTLNEPTLEDLDRLEMIGYGG